MCSAGRTHGLSIFEHGKLSSVEEPNSVFQAPMESVSNGAICSPRPSTAKLALRRRLLLLLALLPLLLLLPSQN